MLTVGERVYVHSGWVNCGWKDIWECYVLSTQFFCKPETTLKKNKAYQWKTNQIMSLPCLKPSNCFCYTLGKKSKWWKTKKLLPLAHESFRTWPLSLFPFTVHSASLYSPDTLSLCPSQGPCTCCSLCLNALAPGLQMTGHLLSFRS